MIRRDGAKVEGINKKGLVVALSQSIVDEVMKVLDQKFICDGEAMGDRYATHGLLETNVDLRTQMYRHQMDVLSTLFARQYPGRTASGAKHDAGPGIDQNVFWIAWTARTTEEKQALWAWLKNNNKEGIVFKRWAATYTPGRPSSGGDMLKCKFWATLSAIVTKRNGTKRSVALHLLGDKSVVIPMGNCTIPANAEIPQAGAVVEIRYLYCYPLPGGSLYQPIYLGQRDDVYPYECSISQLKFKPTDSDEE
jgi:bifunctional non-homologous end joining protein LigD